VCAYPKAAQAPIRRSPLAHTGTFQCCLSIGSGLAVQVPAVVTGEAMDAFVKDVPNAAYTAPAKAAKAARKCRLRWLS